MDSTRVDSRVHPRTDYFDVDWLDAVIHPPAPYDPALYPPIVQQSADTRYRPDRSLYNNSEATPGRPGMGVSAGFDPAIQEWLIDSVRTGSRFYWRSREEQQGWLFGSVPYAGVSRDSQRYFSRRYWTSDQPEISWIVPSVIWDAQLGGHDVASSTYRLRKRLDADQSAFVYPDTYAATRILSELTARRTSRLLVDQQDISWIFTNLPVVFDPSTIPWGLAGDITAKSRYWTGDPQQFDWLYQGVLLDPAIWPAMPIQSTRMPRALGRLVVDPVEVSWIFVNLPAGAYDAALYPPIAQLSADTRKWVFQQLTLSPPVGRGSLGGVEPPVAFDPAKLSWVLAADRMVERLKHFRWLAQKGWGGAAILDIPLVVGGWKQLLDSYRAQERRRNVLNLLSIQETAWIFQNLPPPPPFDPSTVMWGIPTVQTSKRTWWTSDPPEITWIVPSAVFDPQLGLWTIPSEQPTGKRAQRVPITDLDVSWIFTATVPAFDPSQQAWAITSQAYKRRTWWTSDPSQFRQLYAITGVTRNSVGTPVGSCDVHLFRTSDDVEIEQTVSDPVTGVYTFITPITGVTYYVVAYKAGAPDIAGTTVNTLTVVVI